MSVSYAIDPKQKLVTTTLRGVVTDEPRHYEHDQRDIR